VRLIKLKFKSIRFCESALVKKITILRGIYAGKEDKKNFVYWDKILEDVKAKNIHTKEAWPNFN